MGFDATHQQVIAVVKKMVCGDGCSNILTGILDKLNRVASGDVFENYAQRREALYQRYQRQFNKSLFSVEYVAMGIGDLPMYQ